MRLRPFQFALPALLAFVMVGCQTRPGYAVRDVQPLYDHQGHARSLTLSSPTVRATQSLPVPYEPWYAGRRDIGPFVTTPASLSQSVTYTIDRQRVYNGRIYDRYDQTTYRRTYRDSGH